MPTRIALDGNRSSWQDATPGGIKVDQILHVPLIASIVVSVVAMVGGLVAQVSNNESVAQAGLWAAIAAMTATACTAITTAVKAYFDNAQKIREHELAKLRQAEERERVAEERERLAAERELARVKLALEAESVKKAGLNNKTRIDGIKRWLHDAKAKFPGLPDPPGFDVDTGDFLIITPDPDHTKTA